MCDSPECRVGFRTVHALPFVTALIIIGCSPSQPVSQSPPEDGAMLQAAVIGDVKALRQMLKQGGDPNLNVGVPHKGTVKTASLLAVVIALPTVQARPEAVRALIDGGADLYPVYWETGLTPAEQAAELLGEYAKKQPGSKAEAEYREIVSIFLKGPLNPRLMRERGFLLLMAPIDAYDLDLLRSAIKLEYRPETIKAVIERVKSDTYWNLRARGDEMVLRILETRLEELEARAH